MKFERLVKLMDDLRAEGGCPWDREQTHSSLKPFLIEEAYELLEVLDTGDPKEMKEELGDLLFQIIFHAQIAKENGEFDIYDVMEGVFQKMVSRHPHVFGEMKLETANEVRGKWEEYKRKEGKLKGSILEGIPKSLPSLLKAYRVQARASRVGFDWTRRDDVISKLDEEFSEFKKAVDEGERHHLEEELGDLFFSLVNVARFLGVYPEDTLHKAVQKFMRRFQYIEDKIRDKGRSLEGSTLDEMDALWEEAKGKEVKR
jgi:tetrapyrrole methylase family protein/MazG family protein